jgi:hypothetical protein
MHEHAWQTQTLEHSISRPTFAAKSLEDCESKLDIRLEEGVEKDSSGASVFDGSVVRIVVDGYVLAKGRSTLLREMRLSMCFRRLLPWRGTGSDI